MQCWYSSSPYGSCCGGRRQAGWGGWEREESTRRHRPSRMHGWGTSSERRLSWKAVLLLGRNWTSESHIKVCLLWYYIYVLYQRERSATQLILTELHQQAASIQLPTTAPRISFPPPSALSVPAHNSFMPTQAVSHSLSPSTLLRSSMHASMVFPTSSMVFHQKPRKPLLKSSHCVKLDSISTSSTAPISVVGSPPVSPPDADNLPITITCAHRHREDLTGKAQRHNKDREGSKTQQRLVSVLPPLQLGKALVAPPTECAATNTKSSTTTATSNSVAVSTTTVNATCNSTMTNDQLLDKHSALHRNRDMRHRAQLPAVESSDRHLSRDQNKARKGKQSSKRESATRQKPTPPEV